MAGLRVILWMDPKLLGQLMVALFVNGSKTPGSTNGSAAYHQLDGFKLSAQPMAALHVVIWIDPKFSAQPMGGDHSVTQAQATVWK